MTEQPSVGPDPSILTTQALYREITALRELLEARLDAMDKAVEVFSENLTRVPTDVDKQVGNLKELHLERFKRVDEMIDALKVRILERDDNVTQAKADAKVGIDAALASAEKLVGQSNDSFKELFEKAERSTEKLLDKQDENQKNSSSALEDKITSIKERVDRIEGAAVGAITAKTDGVVTQTMDRGGSQFTLSLVMAGVGIIGLLVTLFVVATR